MKSNKTTTVSTITPARKAELKAAIIGAVKGCFGAFVSLTKAVEEAKQAGVEFAEIKSWTTPESTGLTRAAISKAFIKAGFRQRGIRCDAGISKSGAAYVSCMPLGKSNGKGHKHAANLSGSVTKPKAFAKTLVKLCGDKAKALALITEVAKLLK